jgi:hypothetical protein
MLALLFAVSNTHSETFTLPPRRGPAVRRRASRLRFLKWIVFLFVCIWLADIGISLVIQHTGIKRRLTSHLEAAFGRNVEVGRYSFSLWGGPALEARSVTVAEDAHFGHEYFLRAESLRVELGWKRLLRGHIELGTLSLTRPSLNLVRNADGVWNLAEWLPQPSSGRALPPQVGPVRPAFPGIHFRKIKVDGGRINFKQGDTKLPFAFTEVEGTVEAENSGIWSIDLNAAPSRAAVLLQRPGTFHLTGHVGGTSSRLRPAALDLSWSDASITDVLRLARTYDYGVYGAIGLSIAAQTEGDSWMFQGRAELRQLHRWDLTLRDDNPSLNIIARARLDPGSSVLELTEAALEAPHSFVHATGAWNWNRTGSAFAANSNSSQMRFVSAGIDLGDLLGWIRAFRTGVADDLQIHGLAKLDLDFRGWPLRIESGSVAINGAELTGASLRVPVRLGSTALQFDAKGFKVTPVVVSFGSLNHPLEGSIRIEASAKPGAKFPANFHLAGNLLQTRDLIISAGMLGWNISNGWDIAGPIRCDLQLRGATYPWQAQPTGVIELGSEASGATLRAPFLNRPIEQIRGLADLKPGERRFTLSSAQAFGAHWTGTFDRRDADTEWKITLSAGALTGGDMDRWLNPRWQESFFDRVLPFLTSRSPDNAVPGGLRASGRLTLDQFTLAPFAVRRLQSDLKIDGRRIELSNARGQFYGGEISGSLVANLEANPAYSATLDFSQVDLHSLGAAVPGFANLFAGLGSGAISFGARGTSRDDLLASLECKGSALVKAPEFRNFNLMESLRDSARRPGTSAFQGASASFSCGDGKLQIQDLTLLGASSEIRGSGSVDSNRNMDFRLSVVTAGASDAHHEKAPAASAASYQVTGPLAAPQIVRIPPAPRKR